MRTVWEEKWQMKGKTDETKLWKRKIKEKIIKKFEGMGKGTQRLEEKSQEEIIFVLQKWEKKKEFLRRKTKLIMGKMTRILRKRKDEETEIESGD